MFQNRRGGRFDPALPGEARSNPRHPDRAILAARGALREALDACGALDGPVSLALGTALGAAERVEAAAGGVAPSSDLRELGFDAFARDIVAPWRDRPGPDGPVSVFSATCVSALCALEQAAADVALGRARRAVVLGVDTLSASMQGGFSALRALSPTGDLRPFRVDHDGVVIGEAAAAFVVEPLAEARSRGAYTRARLLGRALRADAWHMTSPEPDGARMAEAISRALAEGGCDPAEIGCVSVTATGAPVYDRMLPRALRRALGAAADRVPVTTWEPATGHVLAATGALAVVHACRVIAERSIPPLPSAGELAADCDLDYVLGEPRMLERPLVLALVVGFGGQNGALLIGADDGTERGR